MRLFCVLMISLATRVGRIIIVAEQLVLKEIIAPIVKGFSSIRNKEIRV